jgi:cob(I)alamin adenosyltransferase
MKIYTKNGDRGQTSLIGGQRVSKTDPRVEAYGTVDELSAHTAMLKDMLMTAEVDEFDGMLTDILRTLMTVEAVLATGEGGAGKVSGIAPEQITTLESEIDTLSGTVKPLAYFTVPGGHVIVSQCHICRTVCRRAEREAYRAAEKTSVSESALAYLNRLSDYFYMLGRRLSEILGARETIWTP